MKKNNKGFTLVELIVVSCMMVIMMGAILNFVKPITNFYRRTWTTADSNDIGNSVMSYFESELRYSTNVLILEDYEGMPQVTDGYLRTAGGAKANSVKFSNVIVLDNENVRGEVFDTYDANDNPAHRKKAAGSIIKFDITGGVIDITNPKIPVSEEVYSDFRAEFTGRLSQDTDNKCLKIGMNLYKPVYNGTVYEFNELSYNQSRDVELVNINLLGVGGTMKALYYSNAVDDAGHPVCANPINYTNFAQAADPGGLNAGQSALYDTSKKYTYIFFTKSVPTTSSTCTIKIMNYDGSATLRTLSVPVGSMLTSSQVTDFINAVPSTTYVSGGNYYDRTCDNLYCSATGKNIDDYTTEEITESMDFVAIPHDTLKFSPDGVVTFMDCFDDTGVDLGGYTHIKTERAYYMSPEANALGLTNTISGIPDGTGDTDWIFSGWNSSSDGTGTPFTDGEAFYGGDYTYYAVYTPRPMYKVRFEWDGGSEEGDYPALITNHTMITTPADPTPPADHQFVGWFKDGDKTQQPFDSYTNHVSDITFKPVFEPIPASGAQLMATLSSVDGKNMDWSKAYWDVNVNSMVGPVTATMKVKIVNIGTEPSSTNCSVKLTVGGGTVSSVSSWDGGITTTVSGNDIIINFNGIGGQPIYPSGMGHDWLINKEIAINVSFSDEYAQNDLGSFSPTVDNIEILAN